MQRNNRQVFYFFNLGL